LRRYALSFEEVSEAIQNASQNIPAGELKKTGWKIVTQK
jgi:Cu/Ag efflux pump CusA